MLGHGAIEEIASLENRLGNTARQAIGLREIQDFLKNRISRTDLLEVIETNTRQYAKRQETWFNKEPYLLNSTLDVARATSLDIVGRLSRERV